MLNPDYERLDFHAVVRLAGVTNRVGAERLTGRGRASSLKVLHALTNLAVHHRSRVVVASARTIALAAGVTTETAWLALNRLVDAKVVEQLPDRTSRTTRRFRLIHEDGELTDAADRPYLDAWRHLGLGAAGCLLYEALDTEQPQTARALAHAAPVHPSTAARKLPQLAAHGLAIHTPTGWLRGPTDPQTVLLPGASGTRAREAARIKGERDHWNGVA